MKGEALLRCKTCKRLAKFQTKKSREIKSHLTQTPIWCLLLVMEGLLLMYKKLSSFVIKEIINKGFEKGEKNPPKIKIFPPKKKKKKKNPKR
jgi:hypothetical protein